MMVAMLAVDMAMCDLFSARSTYTSDLALKSNRPPGQRMVAVEHDHRPFDFDHVKDLWLPTVVESLQLTTDFDAGRKLRLGYGFHQRFISRTKSIIGSEFKMCTKARALALEQCFDFWEYVAVATVQVRQVATVKCFSDLVSDFVGQCDRGVLSDVHVGVAMNSRVMLPLELCMR